MEVEITMANFQKRGLVFPVPSCGVCGCEDVHLDYVTDLRAHSTDFAAVSMDEAVDFICSAVEIGDPVSVYAYSDGSNPSSAHQIHRNDHYPDGAIVADPTSAAPLYLLLRYADQVF